MESNTPAFTAASSSGGNAGTPHHRRSTTRNATPSQQVIPTDPGRTGRRCRHRRRAVADPFSDRTADRVRNERVESFLRSMDRPKRCDTPNRERTMHDQIYPTHRHRAGENFGTRNAWLISFLFADGDKIGFDGAGARLEGTDPLRLRWEIRGVRQPRNQADKKYKRHEKHPCFSRSKRTPFNEPNSATSAL